MDTPTTASRGPKIALMGGIAVLAIVAIVYFSFFYPPVKSEDVRGTIGAAKKYRSEQITDKDVKLEGQNAEAIASSDAIADVQAAHEFASTAAAFENTFKALDNKVKLDATFRDAYQRTALAMNNVAKSLERAPVSSYDARAVADLRNSAASLERTARVSLDRTARVSLDRTARASLESSAAMDMRAQMSSIDARATTLQRSMSVALESRSTIDSRPSAAIDARAKIDARSTVDNKAQKLDNRPGVGNKAR